MAFLDWFSQNISRPVLSAGQWLGKNVLTPALDWTKQNIPVVGEIVNAAQPAIDAAGKVWNYAAAKSRGEEAEAPTLNDLAQGISGAAKGIGAALAARRGGSLANVGSQAKMAAMNQLNTVLDQKLPAPLSSFAKNQIQSGLAQVSKRARMM